MLDIGTGIRYKSLGAGIVENHLTRDFQGQERIFAEIYFPHRDMKAQIPIGDPGVDQKLEPLMDKQQLQQMLSNMSEAAKVLSRAWDIRAQTGEAALKNGGPEEWIELLGSYALAEGSGVEIAASDDDLVRHAEELIASELCCSCNKEFSWAVEQVQKAYSKTVAEASKSKQQAGHFAAVEVENAVALK